MAASLGTLTLDLVARIASFTDPLRQAEQQSRTSTSAIERHAQNTTASLKSMAAASLGFLSVGALFGAYVQNTQDAENEQAQLAATLKSTGFAAKFSQDQLNDMSGAMSALSTLSGGEITQAQTTLLAFTGIVGNEFPRALQAAIDMATRTGTSVVSAAETVGRALDVPSQGLTALSKQGFRFTEDQKVLAKQLEATGRTAEAQAIILNALEDSYGGAAAAARDTFSGALVAAKNAANDLLTGDGSLELAKDVLNGVTDALARPEARQALEALTVAAVGYAIVMAGRVVASNVAASISFITAQREVIRYNAALAAMAGMSTRAAAAQTLLGTATRGAGAVLGVFGGPLGLAATIGISAAAYLLLRDNSSAADRALESSAKYADITTQSFNNLKNAQQDVIKSDLKEAFNAQGAELDRLANNYASLTDELIFYAKQQGLGSKYAGDFIEIQKGVRNGTIAYADALDRLNSMEFLTTAQKKQALDAIDAYNKQYGAVVQTGTSLDAVGAKYTIAGSAAQNAASGIAASGNAAAVAAGQVDGLSKSMQDYIDKTEKGIFNNKVYLRLRELGQSPAMAQGLTDAVSANDGKPVSVEQARLVKESVALNEAVAASKAKVATASKAAAKVESEADKARKKADQDAKNRNDQLQSSYKDLLYSMNEQSTLIGKTGETSKLVYRMMYGDLSKLSQKQKENLELTSRSLDQRQKEYQFEQSKKDLTDQLAIARTLNAEDQKMLELRKQFFEYSADQQAELIIYSKRLDAIKEFNDVFSSNKTDEEAANAETTRQLNAINYGLQNVTLSEKEYQQAIKARQDLIGASVLPNYTPELSGAGNASMIGSGAKLSGALGQIEEATTAGVALDDSYVTQKDLLREQYEGKEELATEYNERMLALDQEYADKRMAVELGVAEGNKNLMLERLDSAESLSGSLADIAAKTLGEQNSIYHAMFAIEKGFAIAKSVMAIQTAMASAAMSLPFPANLGAMASVAASVAGIVSTIQSVSMVGQAHDGIMEVPDSGTWNLQRGERVLPQKTAANLDRTLEQVKSKNQNAVSQAPVNLNPNFVIVDERENLADYLFSPDGTKAFVKFFKRNRSALGV